jgi:hypothetical protein
MWLFRAKQHGKECYVEETPYLAQDLGMMSVITPTQNTSAGAGAGAGAAAPLRASDKGIEASPRGRNTRVGVITYYSLIENALHTKRIRMFLCVRIVSAMTDRFRPASRAYKRSRWLRLRWSLQDSSINTSSQSITHTRTAACSHSDLQPI